MPNAEIQQLLDELKSEQTAQQQAIQDAVKKELHSSPIRYEQLDNSLKSMIMSKSTGTGEGTGSGTVPKKVPASKEKAKGKQIDPTIDPFQKVCDDLIMGNNVYLYGKAGTGKTVLAKDVALYLLGDRDDDIEFQKGKKTIDGNKVPCYFLLNCSQWTSPMQILGGFSIKGYTEGQLELAWRYGAVLILDELPKLDPNTAGLLNEALAMSADPKAIITNGRGERIEKHEDFMVIGAGNTDMKTTSGNFSGNNRQDYSLVDRFTGSMYVIGENVELETRLTYRAVYAISKGIRDFLQKAEDSVEAITLRSMLNFNRIYEIEMLRKTRSPLAFSPVGTDQDPKKGIVGGKTLKDSVKSFINSLASDRAKNLEKDARFQSLETSNLVNLESILVEAESALSMFREDYIRLNGKDPRTGERVKKAE